MKRNVWFWLWLAEVALGFIERRIVEQRGYLQGYSDCLRKEWFLSEVHNATDR